MMNLVDLCTTSDYDDLWFECLDGIERANETLADNYKGLTKDEFISLPVVIKDNEIVAFSGLQANTERWGPDLYRASSRFWLHPNCRIKGLVKFDPTADWIWHNAQMLIPHQIGVAVRLGLPQLFISRNRKDRRSFPNFIELVNHYSDFEFKMQDGIFNVCGELYPIPDSCKQLIAVANLRDVPLYLKPL